MVDDLEFHGAEKGGIDEEPDEDGEDDRCGDFHGCSDRVFFNRSVTVVAPWGKFGESYQRTPESQGGPVDA